jgi:hypothetical protein
MNFSAMKVEYEVTETGVAVSLPVTTWIPTSHQSNLTYQDGYDSDYSDGVIGPFFDAVDDHLADDDEQCDDVEHQGVSAVIEPSNQPSPEAEVTQCTYPAEFIPRETLQTFTISRIQEELQKLKLPVGGRKEVLLDFDAPTAAAHPTGTAQVEPPMTGFSTEAKWKELKCSDR